MSTTTCNRRLLNIRLQATANGVPLGQASAAAGGDDSPRLPGMGMWFDVMRDIEHLMNDYKTIFDGWERGGVDGLVIVSVLPAQTISLLPA
jgi:hypothetical protein|eukprot:COSAG06_NODE_16498_length_997_cov_3.320713_1_plen_91_part_00